MRYYLCFAISLFLMLPLIAAETGYVFEPAKIRIEKSTEKHRDLSYHNIYYGNNLIMRLVPDNLLPYFVNLKSMAEEINAQLRCKCNPLDINFNLPEKIKDNFFVAHFEEIIDLYEPNEILLTGDRKLVFPDEFFLTINGQRFKIDEGVFEYLRNIKTSAIKKNCKIFMNLGFINPLPPVYDQMDLRTHIRLDLPEQKVKIDSPICAICLGHGANIALNPCGHIVAHEQCYLKESACPKCRTEIIGHIKIFQ